MIKLSPGKHNQLHADIVYEFCSHFVGEGGRLLYIGDTASSRNEGGKLMFLEVDYLESLGVPPMSHDKLPDVMVYNESRERLFLIEAVTSHGPVSPKRWVELEDTFKDYKAGLVYVTTFSDRAEFRKNAADIAWETEVWIADNPYHMIHFNGNRSLGRMKELIMKNRRSIMFILKKAVVNKYKSYTTEQEIQLESDVTTLVGKNESGKTAFLEVLAKLNYFTDDKDFKFNEYQDYPRSELREYQRSDSNLQVICCTFQIDKDTISEINSDLGEGVLTADSFIVAKRYKAARVWFHLHSDEKKYLENLQSKLNFSDATKLKIMSLKTIENVISQDAGEDEEFTSVISHLNNNIVSKAHDWDNLIDGYITKNYLSPRLPRFWYFDEYHELPSRVNIDDIRSNTTTDGLTKQQLETAKALFELARIDVEELASSTNFELFTAELEAASNDITDTIFKYWSTNNNLAIDFKIDQTTASNSQPAKKILDIRVKNDRHRITLPLKNRSKGFNWFFSFIVWFSKIQDEKDKNFILLLDEPGLNLHASAQADLLHFISDLSKDYQVVYTTHSPFMVESNALHRVRTVYDSEENGSIISEAIQEKDPDTLFPLQAALGYDIAQNLFVSKNNLLVEGPADLNYLTFMSNLLESKGGEGLRGDITIIPVGGLDKVASFISLLRGSKLKVSCLLDTFNNAKGTQRLGDLIQSKIIKDKHVRFFHEFAGKDCKKADIEDMFEKSEYLKIFGEAFPDHRKITVSDLDKKKPTILLQLKAILNGKSFNHYKPSQLLSSMGPGADSFSKETLEKFEIMFKEVNSLY